MKLHPLAAALLLIAAAPALAGTPINESRALAADGNVEIENVKGKITVRTWANPQVRVTGTLGKGAAKLAIQGDARNLSIVVKYPEVHKAWGNWSKGNDGEPTYLEVMIPARASLDIGAVSADVDVQQMAGRNLEVASVSGNVIVTASSPGQASFENVSGDTTLKITSNKVEVQSVSGDIDLQGGLSGEVQLETVSGNATLAAKRLERLEFSSVSGDARLQAGLAPNGVIEIESLSGGVSVTLARPLDANLDIETFSGSINSAVGTIKREEYGPGRTLNAKIGQGTGRIRVESFSGDVDFVLK